MNIEHIRDLYNYNEWANREVWQCVEQLTEEQFEQPIAYSVGSIHNQIVHSMSAEWMWLSRLNGVSPIAMFHTEDYPTRELIQVRWREIEGEFQNYLNNLAEADLEKAISYKRTTGEANSLPVWGILVHVVNHATNHRAQILAALHTLGAPTVEMDLVFYLLGKQDT